MEKSEKPEKAGAQIDLLSIGDITTDAFIRLEEASVHCDINHHDCQLCMSFGDKIPYEFVEVVKAVGNAPNAAVSGARLGLRSALAANVGDDQNGRDCLAALGENGIAGVGDFVKINTGKKTNYHYVLWYESERTILVKHEAYEYHLPAVMAGGASGAVAGANAASPSSAPRWIYLTSLGEASLPYHDEIVAYLKAHPETKLAFQPGTYQMKFGRERLAELYRETDIFFCNVEEAQRILGITDPESADAKPLALLAKIHALGPRITVITDGPNGAYVLDAGLKEGGVNAANPVAWQMPLYPDPKPPYERTGAGDAFSSTFVAAIALGKSIEEALRWAPINPMSVVQFIGAQKGLLTRAQLEECLSKAPADYQPKKLS